MMEFLLTSLGILASVVLMVLCFVLAHRRYMHLQIVAGQTIFAWMGVVLLAVTLSRFATFVFGMSPDVARQITGAVYILCVAGIMWSVARHARIRAN